MNNRIYFEKILSQDDFEYFLDLVSNEKVMVMNYGRVFTLEEAKKVYKGLLEKNKIHQDFGQFKIFEVTTNAFIGLGGLIISDDFTEAEVEYLLLPDYWGMGYGSDIVRELLNKAEGMKSIQQVTGIIDPSNIASRKILIKNGFISCKVYEIDDGSLAEVLSKKII